MLRVDPHVLRRRHRPDRHGALVPERLVRPRPHRADELDRREPVVRDEHRVDRSVAAHLAAAGLDLGVEGGDALGHAHLERVGALPGWSLLSVLLRVGGVEPVDVVCVAIDVAVAEVAVAVCSGCCGRYYGWVR